jgi:bifunctional non-homologous end joining protein LigD
MTPWKQKAGANAGYDAARDWAMTIAQRVVAALPDLATLERSKSARHGKAYFDVMQNARGKHVVPPYVLRAVPDATVSMPLDWTDLTAKLTPRKFDIKTAAKIFAKSKSDPLKLLLPRNRT